MMDSDGRIWLFMETTDNDTILNKTLRYYTETPCLTIFRRKKTPKILPAVLPETWRHVRARSSVMAPWRLYTISNSSRTVAAVNTVIIIYLKVFHVHCICACVSCTCVCTAIIIRLLRVVNETPNLPTCLPFKNSETVQYKLYRYYCVVLQI